MLFDFTGEVMTANAAYRGLVVIQALEVRTDYRTVLAELSTIDESGVMETDYLPRERLLRPIDSIDSEGVQEYLCSWHIEHDWLLRSMYGDPPWVLTLKSATWPRSTIFRSFGERLQQTTTHFTIRANEGAWTVQVSAPVRFDLVDFTVPYASGEPVSGHVRAHEAAGRLAAFGVECERLLSEERNHTVSRFDRPDPLEGEA